ncbi:MAG TPA: carboxymuconolactone decarboxylase family protein [Thermohalobaculum sp.]|nr:carboxymuconolactone decarboxylase family protein [Thermohalobaculum sp.]
MSRLPELPRDAMTDDQRRIHDEIMSGPRGRVEGPLKIWLNSPGLAEVAQKLGAYMRFGSRLPPRLSELAIIVTGAHYKAEYEWYAHVRFAHDAGIPEAVTEAIRVGETPDLPDPEQRIVYQVAVELAASHGLSDATYAEAVAVLGVAALVDLIAIIGYYGIVSLTLNTFEIPTPDGSAAFS